MDIQVRPYTAADLPAMTAIWNQVVEDGVAFPQDTPLTLPEAGVFFAGQTATAVAVDENGTVLGLYILHPNNVGRCGHISNASFAVRADLRGQRLGERLVRHALDAACTAGFRLMQFNAVVATNAGALRLYEKLGFRRLGTIPGGFRQKDGAYVDIVLYYIELPRSHDNP